MIPHRLSFLTFLLLIIVSDFARLPPAFANEVKLQLAKNDDYAIRSILVDLKSGNSETGCEQLSINKLQANAFVCRQVSGATKTYLLREIKTILFPLILRNQNQQIQQACVPQISQASKKEVTFVIPEQQLRISDNSLKLSSSWIAAQDNVKPKLSVDSIDRRLGLATILEPLSLSYQAQDKTFLFKTRYAEYKETVICSSGGGSGWGGKGGGRRHRNTP